VMIGATPNSAFLAGLCEVDDRGFIVTDRDKATTIPGLYAVGDVRSGSVKRVANAVGEGATCVPHLWGHLNPSPGDV
jgi:thioredoxin reductase (NADPH)